MGGKSAMTLVLAIFLLLSSGITGLPFKQYSAGVAAATTRQRSGSSRGSAVRNGVIPQYQDESTKEIALLHDENFDDFARTKPNLLVGFYAPWCPHSNIWATEFEQVASEIKKLGGGITIAKVDAHSETQIEAKKNVLNRTNTKILYPFVPGVQTALKARARSFPTMVLYHYGKPHLEYTVPRDIKHGSLLQAMSLLVRPSSIPLFTIEEVEQTIRSHRGNFTIAIGFYEDMRRANLFTELGTIFRETILFFHVASPDRSQGWKDPKKIKVLEHFGLQSTFVMFQHKLDLKLNNTDTADAEEETTPKRSAPSIPTGTLLFGGHDVDGTGTFYTKQQIEERKEVAANKRTTTAHERFSHLNPNFVIHSDMMVMARDEEEKKNRNQHNRRSNSVEDAAGAQQQLSSSSPLPIGFAFEESGVGEPQFKRDEFTNFVTFHGMSPVNVLTGRNRALYSTRSETLVFMFLPIDIYSSSRSGGSSKLVEYAERGDRVVVEEDEGESLALPHRDKKKKNPPSSSSSDNNSRASSSSNVMSLQELEPWAAELFQIARGRSSSAAAAKGGDPNNNPFTNFTFFFVNPLEAPQIFSLLGFENSHLTPPTQSDLEKIRTWNAISDDSETNEEGDIHSGSPTEKRNQDLASSSRLQPLFPTRRANLIGVVSGRHKYRYPFDYLAPSLMEKFLLDIVGGKMTPYVTSAKIPDGAQNKIGSGRPIILVRDTFEELVTKDLETDVLLLFANPYDKISVQAAKAMVAVAEAETSNKRLLVGIYDAMANDPPEGFGGGDDDKDGHDGAANSDESSSDSGYESLPSLKYIQHRTKRFAMNSQRRGGVGSSTSVHPNFKPVTYSGDWSIRSVSSFVRQHASVPLLGLRKEIESTGARGEGGNTKREGSIPDSNQEESPPGGQRSTKGQSRYVRKEGPDGTLVYRKG